MQFSVDWLKQYVSTKTNAHQIADRLTMSVNEVDEVRSLTGLKDIVVAEVITLERHPDADSLWITEVSTGAKRYRIVTGADNLAVGEKVPLAVPGTTLPDGLKIAKRKLRGVMSEGMLCSARELGAGEDHAGIWLLPADAPGGKSLATALGSRIDSFDLDVPANRPDLTGHLGVAREVAAAFDVRLTEPKLKTPNRKRKGVFTPKISDTSQCSRFALARIRGLKNAQSPNWIKERLTAVGLRPINAVVDVTNFVMLETGQPLHAYDFSKLTGVMMYVRGARADESLKTLDGKTRRLPKGTPVIADRNQVIGIAGIMGGANSEVTTRTDDVVLECACFDAATVRRASRALGLRTDASARFEKGPSPEQVWPAIRRAIDLILEACGGELVELVDTYPRKARSTAISLTSERVESFLGLTVPLPKIKRQLEQLGFAARSGRGKLTVTPPYWRTDVSNEADVLEEVARTVGYDQLPTALPSGPLAVPYRPPLDALERTLRDELMSAGFTEVLTHSLVGSDLLQRTGYPQSELAAMQNPLSADHAFLRRSMEPRHLEAIGENLRWSDSLQFFEIGRTFKRSQPKGKVTERTRLMVSVATKRKGERFAEVRGALTALAEALKIPQDELTFVATEESQYPDGRQFNIVRGQAILGHVAEYAFPNRIKAGAVAFLSLELDRVLKALPEQWNIAEPPEFPEIRRDLSLFVPEQTTYAEVRETISRAGGDLLRSVTDPEEFRPQGKRSLKVSLVFGADRTLTDKVVNAAMEPVLAAVKKQGWKVRE
jgi:phenylalanyl-tRNA synthetase beta chain